MTIQTKSVHQVISHGIVYFSRFKKKRLAVQGLVYIKVLILPLARLEECPATGCICHEAEEDLARKPPVDAFLKAEKSNNV